MVHVAVDQLETLVHSILLKNGIPPSHTQLQADLLLFAELSGQSSHGLLRLPRIVERIANGLCDPRTTGRRFWVRDGFLDVDGEMGLGPVVATAALNDLCDRVATTG